MIKTEFHGIGPGLAPYLIAEIGLNHNGSLDLARRMVDGAKASGAHAAKFQLYHSDVFLDPRLPLGDGPPGSLSGFFRTFELSESDWIKLADHTRASGLDFFCSVFDRPSLDFYPKLSPRLTKIASCDINNRLLLEDCLELGLPILLSTGTADESEVARAVAWVGKHPTVLFQCVSSYPAKPSQYNLNVLTRWREKFNLPLGISDHCSTNAVSFAAVALGACAIEKHFTLDHDLPGPDQKISLNPAGFRDLADGVKTVFESLGDGNKICTPEELPVRSGGRRSVVVNRKMAAGEKIERADLTAWRPGGGFPPDRYQELVGTRASRSYEPGDPAGL